MSTSSLWVTQKVLKINIHQVINNSRFRSICYKGTMLKTSAIFLDIKEKRVFFFNAVWKFQSKMQEESSLRISSTENQNLAFNLNLSVWKNESYGIIRI